MHSFLIWVRACTSALNAIIGVITVKHESLGYCMAILGLQVVMRYTQHLLRLGAQTIVGQALVLQEAVTQAASNGSDKARTA